MQINRIYNVLILIVCLYIGIFCQNIAYSDVNSNSAGLLIQEQNGTNAGRYRVLDFSNGSTTNNGDGSISVTTGCVGHILTGITNQTGTFTVLATDAQEICNSASAIICNLPAATGTNRVLGIKNIGAGTVTITPNGSDTIDGNSTQYLMQYESMSLLDYAVGVWLILT
jgi:hypothetical protein